MYRKLVLYAKNDYGDGYNFQDVFFNSHPVNKKNPNPIEPKKEKQPPPSPPENNNKTSNQPKPKKKPKKKKYTIVKFILSLILIILLLISGYTITVISRLNYSRDNPDEEYVINEVGELKSDSQVENIMIFGTDNHTKDENGRSDSIILISIDKNHNIIKQTSFMRDLYVTIPKNGKNKLNAAFSIGGAKLAVETIEYNFNIKIDSYVVIDFDSFIDIINKLEGIDIELTEEEIDYINWQSWRNNQVESRYEIDSSSYEFYTNDNNDYVAKVHLNGRQALWYARDRDSAGSDFDRTSRQRIVIDTIISKLKSLNPFTLMKVVYDTAPMITTNINLENALKMSFGMFGYLHYNRMEFRIPQSFNCSNEWIGDSQVLNITNIEEEKKALYQFVFESEK